MAPRGNHTEPSDSSLEWESYSITSIRTMSDDGVALVVLNVVQKFQTGLSSLSMPGLGPFTGPATAVAPSTREIRTYVSGCRKLKQHRSDQSRWAALSAHTLTEVAIDNGGEGEGGANGGGPSVVPPPQLQHRSLGLASNHRNRAHRSAKSAVAPLLKKEQFTSCA